MYSDFKDIVLAQKDTSKTYTTICEKQWLSWILGLVFMPFEAQEDLHAFQLGNIL